MAKFAELSVAVPGAAEVRVVFSGMERWNQTYGLPVTNRFVLDNPRMSREVASLVAQAEAAEILFAKGHDTDSLPDCDLDCDHPACGHEVDARYRWERVSDHGWRADLIP